MQTVWVYSICKAAPSEPAPVRVIVAGPAWVQAVLNTVQAGFPSPATTWLLSNK